MRLPILMPPRRRRRFSIVTLATAATLVPLLVVGGVLIALSHRSNHRLSSDLGDAMVAQTVSRVDETVQRYLGEVARMSQTMASSIERGAIRPDDMCGWEARMNGRLDTEPEIESVGYVDVPSAQYVYIARSGTSREVGLMGPSVGPDRLETCLVDSSGEPDPASRKVVRYQIAMRPWYREAIDGGPPGWTASYVWVGGTAAAWPHNSTRGIAYTQLVRATPPRAAEAAPVMSGVFPKVMSGLGATTEPTPVPPPPANERAFPSPADPTIRAVISIDLTLRRVSEHLASVAAPMGAVLIMSEGEGRVIASADPRVPENWPADDVANEPATTPTPMSTSAATSAVAATVPAGRPDSRAVEQAIAARLREAGRNAFMRDADSTRSVRIAVQGSAYYVAEVPVDVSPRVRWRLLVAVPEPAAVVQAHADMTRDIWIGAAYIGVAALISVLLARSIGRPIGDLAAFAGRIAQGNFQRRAADCCSGKAREVVELCDALDHMGEALRERISLLAAKEAAEEAGAAKGRLIAHVSHEFRTPLNAVVGYAELLREAARTAGRDVDAKDAGNILLASRQLLELVENLLDLSRAEAGRLPLNVCEFSVADLVQGVLSTVGPLLAENGNRLHLDLPQPPDVRMSSDPARLTQVLTNVLANAAKFTNAGQVTLSVHVDEPANQIRFETVDTGVGIVPQLLPFVFEAFAQAHDEGPSRQPRGAGLGLAIARQLCELLGGTIDLSSAWGQGTRVIVVVPRNLVIA